MRLWSIHPKYLDTQGLLGLWREGLLAQEVLAGKTENYKNHPQLNRFKKENSMLYISAYLWEIWKEGSERGYKFIWQKIWKHRQNIPEWVYQGITINNKQLEYEFNHLQKKLVKRDYNKMKENQIKNMSSQIESHPLFEVIEGNIENWEKIK